MLLKISVFLQLATFSTFLIIGCASSKNKIDKNEISSKQHDHPPLPLPHGTVNVSATFIKFLEKENGTACLFRIDTVLGYGVSTPPLAAGTEIEMDVSDNLLNKKEQLSLNFFQTESTHKLSLHYLGWARRKKILPAWRIIKIIK